MRAMILLVVCVLSAVLPVSITTSASAIAQPQALIISSIEKWSPMAHVDDMQNSLMNAGYQVTFMHDNNVTVSFLLGDLGNFDLVVWRTDSYTTIDYRTFWYIGEVNNATSVQTHAADRAAGFLDDSNGIIGVSSDFFRVHLGKTFPNRLKLMILESSMAETLASTFVSLGVRTVIETYGTITSFSSADAQVAQVISFLTHGLDVQTSIAELIAPYLGAWDSQNVEFPQIWYAGDPTLTLS